uniref:Gypsy retrotransposon integrase-like protein 1 n=1 Tax=Cajanus cajan TaxID=3821 RepID=A0A151RTU4_CAJCA|nr:Gypsy retrotransposon integrase-like protein 1 [Cajanus cajan]
MRLNPAKCTFGVAGGKFLGFMLSKRGIEANPDKCQAIVNMRSPRNVKEETECLQVQQGDDNWMTNITRHLSTGELPSNPLKARKLRVIAARYTLIAGELYKRGVSSPLLKCLAPKQAHYVLHEIHEGICGTHSGGRTLAAKVIRAGYYWPTLTSDCVKFTQQCKPCQQHSPLTNLPAEELHFITTPWPFLVWDMDILGPFPPAKGLVKFLIVAVDHFTKWIEAEAVATISASNVQKFFWKNVTTRFGTSTKETPFRLAYGTNAMISVEIGEPSLRRQQFTEEANGEALNVELDLIEETRDRAFINMEACRARVSRKHRTKIKPREFHLGDLVWRVVREARRDRTQGKLAPDWDGPFRIRHNLNNEVYKLEELNGKIIPRTWNVTHLKHYFS